MWHLFQAGRTWQLHPSVDQTVIALVEARRHPQLDLRNNLAVDACDGRVILLYYMQDHAVIGRVLVVVMAFPVAGTHMDFHIAHPQPAINFHLGVEKVWASISVEQARVNHAHTAPVVGHHVLAEPQPVLPDVLQQSLHHNSPVHTILLVTNVLLFSPLAHLHEPKMLDGKDFFEKFQKKFGHVKKSTYLCSRF